MFNLFEAIAAYHETFWGTYFDQIAETHFRQEMLLQLQVASSGKSESEITPRDIHRLETISAAARAFLEQNRPITSLAHWPFALAWEEIRLRQFIRRFLSLERELARRAGLSNRDWRVLHERTLAKTVAANNELYALVASGRCDESVQRQLEGSLSGQFLSVGESRAGQMS